MVRSLRAFGGSMANMPVIAVVGRLGAPLRRATTAELRRLGVTIVRADSGSNPATWFNYGNKAAAVVTADRLAQTEQVTWLDSDMVFIGEPKSIVLEKGEELAVAPIATPPAVYPGEDLHVGYWRELCKLLGVDFDDVPWVEIRGQKFKLNCNSGVFTWRRGSGFAQRYHDAFCRLLRARLAQASGEFFTVDQVILTPLAMGMKWKSITAGDHAFSPSDFFKFGIAPSLEGVRLLHYSTSFKGPYRAEIMGRIAAASPVFSEWLKTQEFEPGATARQYRLFAAALRVLRGLRYRAFDQRVIKIA